LSVTIDLQPTLNCDWVSAHQFPCPLLAQSGHPDALNQCPLLGVKRTLIGTELPGFCDLVVALVIFEA